MSRALKTLERSEVPASITLTSNAEQLAWKIHQLSVAVADREPSAVSHGLRSSQQQSGGELIWIYQNELL